MEKKKDRPTLAMIINVENKELITANKVMLIELTSRNTWINITFMVAMKGYKIILTTLSYTSSERKEIQNLWLLQMMVNQSLLNPTSRLRTIIVNIIP